ncbi:flagellar biosynthetic protein FliQ, partial [Rhizobium brockwellii]|uniref:flagellar biosynthetic protein FliQ n=1 Tax=Rhizobium brockwellii TaxID=3019932 RepID=UPI003F968BED
MSAWNRSNASASFIRRQPHIALIQALTQVQEATLTFVPKIVAVLIKVGVTAPFVGSQVQIFTNLVFSRI